MLNSNANAYGVFGPIFFIFFSASKVSPFCFYYRFLAKIFN